MWIVDIKRLRAVWEIFLAIKVDLLIASKAKFDNRFQKNRMFVQKYPFPAFYVDN